MADTPGFAVAAAEVVSELRMAGLECAEVAEQCVSTADLAEVYDSALVEGGLTDKSAILLKATSALGKDDFQIRSRASRS